MKPKTKIKKDKFQKVVESATLNDVILVSSKSESYIHYSSIIPNKTKLDMTKQVSQPNISEPNNKNSSFLSTHINFTVSGKSKENIETSQIKKDDPLFSISTSYIITYTINNVKTLDSEMLNFFGKNNSYFNVYPYLREYINYMSVRLNIPPVILPLLKPENKIK